MYLHRHALHHLSIISNSSPSGSKQIHRIFTLCPFPVLCDHPFRIKFRPWQINVSSSPLTLFVSALPISWPLILRSIVYPPTCAPDKHEDLHRALCMFITSSVVHVSACARRHR